MPNIKISDFGRPGFVKDIAEYDSVPEAWNEVRNVRFNPIGAQSFAGHAAVMSPASVPVPLWLKVFPPIDRPLWVYGDNEKMFAFDSGHNEITRVSGNYTGQSNERWQGEVFQNIGIFNNVLDVPQAWLTFDAGVRLVDLPHWPSDLRCKALRPFKNYLIAMYMIEAGAERPYRVRWSDAADPGTVPSSWALNDPTKDSGDFDIAETSDYIVDGLGLGDLFIVYKQRSTYAMQLIGGQFIFAKQQILSSRGLLWRDCVQQFPGGHFVAGLDDIYVHNGNPGSDQSLVEARLRNWVFNQIDSSNFFNCYTVKYIRKNEYWFCFPEAGEIYPTLALVWNSVTNGIGIRDIPRSPFIYPGPVDINQGVSPIWGEDAVAPTGGPVTFVAGSEDRDIWVASSTFDFVLANSDILPADFPDALLVLTLSTHATGFVPGGGFTPSSITIDGVGFTLTTASGSAGFGSGQQGIVVAIIRIPPGGFIDPTVHINWPIIGTSELTANVTSQVFYNVNPDSDDFSLGVIAEESLSGISSSFNVPANGGVFAAQTQYTGGDVAPQFISNRPPFTELYTFLNPPITLGDGHYFLNGYKLFSSDTLESLTVTLSNDQFRPVVAFVMSGTG